MINCTLLCKKTQFHNKIMQLHKVKYYINYIKIKAMHLALMRFVSARFLIALFAVFTSSFAMTFISPFNFSTRVANAEISNPFTDVSDYFEKTFGTEDDEEEDDNIALDYYQAMNAYAEGNNTVAIEKFEYIITKYPSARLSKSARIMIAYLNYLDQEYENTIRMIDEFLSMYPKTKYKPYLEYMKALCVYRRITGITKSYEMIVKSIEAMQYVAKQYPNTTYGDDAAKKVKFLRNVLAYNEISIGQEYQSKEVYYSAIKRYNMIVKTKQPSFLPIALMRLSECYEALGINDLAAYYKEEYDKSMVDFNGDVSFTIENVVSYRSQQDIDAEEMEKITVEAEKERSSVDMSKYVPKFVSDEADDFSNDIKETGEAIKYQANEFLKDLRSAFESEE